MYSVRLNTTILFYLIMYYDCTVFKKLENYTDYAMLLYNDNFLKLVMWEIMYFCT